MFAIHPIHRLVLLLQQDLLSWEGSELDSEPCGSTGGYGHGNVNLPQCPSALSNNKDIWVHGLPEAQVQEACNHVLSIQSSSLSRAAASHLGLCLKLSCEAAIPYTCSLSSSPSMPSKPLLLSIVHEPWSLQSMSDPQEEIMFEETRPWAMDLGKEELMFSGLANTKLAWEWLGAACRPRPSSLLRSQIGFAHLPHAPCLSVILHRRLCRTVHLKTSPMTWRIVCRSKANPHDQSHTWIISHKLPDGKINF